MHTKKSARLHHRLCLWLYTWGTLASILSSNANFVSSLVDGNTRYSIQDTLLRKARSRWSSNITHPPQSDTLLTFTAANIGHRTSAFLASLSTTRDAYDLLAVDECSTDNTPGDLLLYNVHTLRINESVGVTRLWNEAWQYFMHKGYDKLIYSNNDVLVPNGVIDKLRAALDNGCDLITPMSTVRGKGHLGDFESMEVCF